MATQFLTILVRHDYMFPVKGVRLLVRCLVHDTLNIRKVCCTSLCASMIWSVLLKEKSVCVCVFMCVCGFCVIFSLCVFAADCICCKLAAVSANEETAHKDTC